MRTYLISYDLSMAAFPFEYTKLAEKIQSYGYWAKPLESVWIIKSQRGAMDILKDLQAAVKPTDKLMVVELTNQWATVNIGNNVNDWLRKMLA